MNKNDLRYIKTEKLIEETYMKLRKLRQRDVRVSDLCVAALINKTTFYKHYETIGQLHRSICSKAIRGIIEEVPRVTSTDALEESVNCLVRLLAKNREYLLDLCNGDTDMIANLIEENLLRVYLAVEKPIEKEAKISFAVGGAVRLLINSQREECVPYIIDFIKKICL